MIPVLSRRGYSRHRQAAAGFDPQDISVANLSVDLRASDLSAGTITTWSGHNAVGLSASNTSATYTTVGGKPRVAIASGQYLTIAYASAISFGSGDFSIELWMTPDSASGYQIVLGKDTDGNRDWGLGFGNTESRPIYFSGPGAMSATGSGNLSGATRTQLVVTRSGTDLSLFVDGSLAASATDSGIYTATNDILIGRREFPSFEQQFVGTVDQIRIWKGYVLTSQDRSDLYSFGLPL